MKHIHEWPLNQEHLQLVKKSKAFLNFMRNYDCVQQSTSALQILRLVEQALDETPHFHPGLRFDVSYTLTSNPPAVDKSIYLDFKTWSIALENDTLELFSNSLFRQDDTFAERKGLEFQLTQDKSRSNGPQAHHQWLEEIKNPQQFKEPFHTIDIDLKYMELSSRFDNVSPLKI